jgi:aminoglycoside phosphotransferase family enzyme
LDLLISKLSPTQTPAQVPFLKNLVQRISEIHNDCSLNTEADECWGSFQQIQAKLESNFAFVESVADESKGLRCFDRGIEREFQIIKNALSTMIVQDHFQECFEQRRKKARIKRCHGDLKTQNIFISSSQPDAMSELAEHIWIIDAIDFNSSFCYIDILSDIAMLAVDIQARCRSQAIAEWIIEYYLELTGQQDSTARTVLSYYMLEKAYIGASVSVIDDDDLATGRNFLKVAQQYIQGNFPHVIGSRE